MTGATQYVDNYEHLAPTLPGQDLPWLRELRKAALARFAASGFPSLREEEWRYTNVSAIEKKFFAPVPVTVSADFNLPDIKPIIASQRLADCWSVVLLNGRLVSELSQLDGLPQEAIVNSVSDALRDSAQAALLANALGQAVSYSEHNLVAFNTAWFSDGVFIHIPANCVLAKPIQILTLVTQADISAVTRNIIAIEKSAEAQIIETFAGENEAYLTAAVTEVVVGENAQLICHKLQCESDKAYHFGGTYVKQERSARFSHHNFAFGGLLARTDIHTDLADASECELNGLYLGINRQHLDNHTRINHLQPHGISREMYKGVLDDRARGVFQGRVIVAENAQKTDSQMSNRNLLLSNDSEADTKPQLEIYADDVKCGHGVTVGQLDEKSVFYLQSRCVDEETARNMLTFAFANEMVEKVKIRSLHDKVLEQVLARFPQEEVDKEWL